MTVNCEPLSAKPMNDRERAARGAERVLDHYHGNAQHGPRSVAAAVANLASEFGAVRAEGREEALASEDERIRVTCLGLRKPELVTEGRDTYGDGYNSGVIAALSALRRVDVKDRAAAHQALVEAARLAHELLDPILSRCVDASVWHRRAVECAGSLAKALAMLDVETPPMTEEMRQKRERGLRDVAAGRTVSQTTVDAYLAGRAHEERAAAQEGDTTMGYGSKSLNEWRDEAMRIATEHGFTDATLGEDIALIHSEASEGLEDIRDGEKPTEVWYEEKVLAYDSAEEPILVKGEHATVGVRHERMYPKNEHGFYDTSKPPYKPCGIPSEMADIVIRVLHFCGKHGIDIEKAVREKMIYNDTRPRKHGGKTL